MCRTSSGDGENAPLETENGIPQETGSRIPQISKRPKPEADDGCCIQRRDPVRAVMMFFNFVVI